MSWRQPSADGIAYEATLLPGWQPVHLSIKISGFLVPYSQHSTFFVTYKWHYKLECYILPGCNGSQWTNTLAYWAHMLVTKKVIFCMAAEADLLNKRSCLAPALGVTKFTNVRDILLVTLCCTF